MTAIAAPASFQLISTVNKYRYSGTQILSQIIAKDLSRTAFLSCDFGSKSTVYCYASVGALQARGTLRPKDLDWMPVTVTTSYEHQRSTGPTISTTAYESSY